MDKPLEFIEIPSEKEAIGTIIWLHGLGSSGNDYSPIVPHMQLPDVRFILPHAPDREITIDGGWKSRAWYDVRSLDENAPNREAPGDIVDSANLIGELIEREVQRGIPTNRIVLCGFSQGGAMSYYIAHRYPETFLGVVVLSGYLIMPELHEIEFSVANERTPFLFCHGERDLLVSVKKGYRALKKSREFHPNSSWQEFPVGHEVCLEELRFLRIWLHERFAKVRV